jgi:hypothetical protein
VKTTVMRATLAAIAAAGMLIGCSATAHADPVLRPGPHSAIADVDLPEGTVPCTKSSCIGEDPATPDPHQEWWHYNAPYDDVVVFLRTRFATGRRYDSHGATYWRGLSPCYDENHQSPPQGWVYDKATMWLWSDGVLALEVILEAPGSRTGGGFVLPNGRLLIAEFSGGGTGCYRA